MGSIVIFRISSCPPLFVVYQYHTCNWFYFSYFLLYKSHDLSEKDADDLVRDFRDEYQGEYDDEEDFAYEIIEECYNLPEFAKTYFDYEKFARDLFMCDYWFDDGFVFRAA